MQDEPGTDEILAAVAAFLRTQVSAHLTSHAVFQAKVAANALDLARRHLTLAPAAEAVETARLEQLLGHGGDLLKLNRELADRISDGSVDLQTAGVAEHLWATTLEKLAVDQPSYSGYRAALAGHPDSHQAD